METIELYMKGIEFLIEKKEYDGNSAPPQLILKIIKDMKHILL